MNNYAISKKNKDIQQILSLGSNSKKSIRKSFGPSSLGAAERLRMHNYSQLYGQNSVQSLGQRNIRQQVDTYGLNQRQASSSGNRSINRSLGNI